LVIHQAATDVVLGLIGRACWHTPDDDSDAIAGFAGGAFSFHLDSPACVFLAICTSAVKDSNRKRSEASQISVIKRKNTIRRTTPKKIVNVVVSFKITQINKMRLARTIRLTTNSATWYVNEANLRVVYIKNEVSSNPSIIEGL
jgi:hypothetical protein